MDSDKIKNIAENIATVFPLLHKKIIKPERFVFKNEMAPSHFFILVTLSECGTMSVSELSKKLFISKPNLTPLIDKLIKEDLVDRCHSVEDRRVINISLKDIGRQYLMEQQEIFVESLKTKLMSLSDEDLEILLVSLENMKHIFLKID